SKSDDGEYDATFGLVITPNAPPGNPQAVCKAHNATTSQASSADGQAAGLPKEDDGYRERRDPGDLSDIQFNVGADCKNYAKVARNPAKTDLSALNRAGADSASGKDSWKWLLLGPAMN